MYNIIIYRIRHTLIYIYIYSVIAVYSVRAYASLMLRNNKRGCYDISSGVAAAGRPAQEKLQEDETTATLLHNTIEMFERRRYDFFFSFLGGGNAGGRVLSTDHISLSLSIYLELYRI